MHRLDDMDLASHPNANLMQLIESHVSSQLRISMPALNLVQLGTPLAFISNDGRIKVSLPNCATKLLMHL